MRPLAVGGEEIINAAVQDEGTFGECLDELPFEVAAATARLLKYARSGAWARGSRSRPEKKTKRIHARRLPPRPRLGRSFPQPERWAAPPFAAG